MSMNQKIITALSGFGFPVVPDIYVEGEETYFVFNYSTVPDDFGDDAPGIERYLIQVHLFCPTSFNAVKIRAEIKKQLFVAGFTWPKEANASGGDGQHRVFECEVAEGVELHGETGG